MSAANDADGIQFTAESAVPAPSGGGTYAFRRSETAGPTLTKRNTAMTEKGAELSANEVDERDIRKKQVVNGRYVLWYELPSRSLENCPSQCWSQTLRMTIQKASISIHRRDLWRYRYFTFICLLLHLLLRTESR